jgi:hydroxymethylpyrimidine pyrophosphatase-like HAD family hydrolase
MVVSLKQARLVAQALAAGGYVLSDNDGTLAPFTQSPDQTVIPRRTMEAIARFQGVFGQKKFTVVTGRDLASIHGVLERSGKGAAASLPILSDDGAIYAFGKERHDTSTAEERGFIAAAQREVRAFTAAQAEKEPGVYGLPVFEYKNNGITLNTNAVHAALGAQAESRVREAYRALFTKLCETSPEGSYALHAAAGYGLEIRSTRVTKRQGLEHLIKEGVLPAGKPPVLLVDDLKTGGNDVAAAQLVKQLGGIVVQVRREDPVRAFADAERAVAPDVVLASPAEVAGFLRAVLREYAQLQPGNSKPQKRPKP